MTYDNNSYELAEHFLQGEVFKDAANYAKAADALAQEIQRAVEDYCESDAFKTLKEQP